MMLFRLNNSILPANIANPTSIKIIPVKTPLPPPSKICDTLMKLNTEKYFRNSVASPKLDTIYVTTLPNNTALLNPIVF